MPLMFNGFVLFQSLKTLFAKHDSTFSLVGSQFIPLKWDEALYNLGGKFEQK